MMVGAMDVTADLIGYPRIGPNRELKWALEKAWSGRMEPDAFAARIAELRQAHIDDQRSAIGSAVDDYFLYDEVLETALMLGIAPDEHATTRVALAYLANVIGSTLGSLLTGYVLLDHLGISGSSLIHTRLASNWWTGASSQPGGCRRTPTGTTAARRAAATLPRPAPRSSSPGSAVR